MPTTDQDARALAYLARRLRADANLPPWDEHGTFSVIAKHVGSNLDSIAERVIRHALDRHARTPGAINRPWSPPAPSERPARPPRPAEACATCGRHMHAADAVCDEPTLRPAGKSAPTVTYLEARRTRRTPEEPA